MTTVPLLDAHTAAIVAGLTGAGLVVGDSVTPPAGGWQAQEGVSAFKEYCIVYQLNPSFDGPLADTHADVEARVQVTSVGVTRQQASNMADKVRTWMLASGVSGITISGRKVTEVDHDGGGDVRRDDKVLPAPQFYAVDRYRVLTTPT